MPDDITSISNAFDLLMELVKDGDWGGDASLLFIFADISNAGWDGDP
jgi:hypothetical protein